jgi:CRP-like cAMP-binding protein
MPKSATLNEIELHDRLAALPSSAAQALNHADLASERDLKLVPRKIGKNKDVIVAGKHYTTLFVNHDGWLLRYKILHNGDRQILDFILPGQIFGLQACLFTASLYSVATITEASLSAVPFDVIDRVLEHSPRLAKVLFWSVVRESATLSEHLIDTARRSAYERVSHLLLELFVRLKQAGLTRDMSFPMQLTQELIGDALGLTTVHVNRTFRALRADKLIAIEDKWVTILDFDALSVLCDFENSYLGGAARAVRDEMLAFELDGSPRGSQPTRLGSPELGSLALATSHARRRGKQAR